MRGSAKAKIHSYRMQYRITHKQHTHTPATRRECEMTTPPRQKEVSGNSDIVLCTIISQHNTTSSSNQSIKLIPSLAYVQTSQNNHISHLSDILRQWDKINKKIRLASFIHHSPEKRFTVTVLL